MAVNKLVAGLYGRLSKMKDLSPNGWAPRLPESFDPELVERYNFAMRLWMTWRCPHVQSITIQKQLGF